MKAPSEPFEHLLDRARHEELTLPERRRLEMLLRSNPEAELEWWLLSDFTYDQMERPDDEHRVSRAVDLALRELGLSPQADAEPELARAEPAPPSSTEVRGRRAQSTRTADQLLAVKQPPARDSAS